MSLPFPTQFTFGTTAFGEYQMLAPMGFTPLTPAVRVDEWTPLTVAQVELNRELAYYQYNMPTNDSPQV